MCVAAGFHRKTAHSMCVTCVFFLFNPGIKDKLIRVNIKDVVFKKGKFKNCTTNVTVSEKKLHVAVLLL